MDFSFSSIEPIPNAKAAVAFVPDSGTVFREDTRLDTRERINAVFTANNIPAEQNVIVFDDFVTTGSTIIAMKNLLDSLGKTSVYFIGINNHLSNGY